MLKIVKQNPEVPFTRLHLLLALLRPLYRDGYPQETTLYTNVSQRNLRRYERGYIVTSIFVPIRVSHITSTIMFSKMKLGLSPLLTSAVGGAAAAALTMVGVEKRLMQASFAAFIYYLIQIPARFQRISAGRQFLLRSLCASAIPFFYFGVERIPAIIQVYRVLVQNSVVLFCICEAISSMYLSLHLSQRVNQSVWSQEISEDTNWLKYYILGGVFALYSICAWAWIAVLSNGFPNLAEGLIFYIALINILIITAVSVIDERGSIIDGVIGSCLLTYCALVSEGVSPLTLGSLASFVFGNASLDVKPFLPIIIGTVIMLVATAIFLDSDSSSSDFNYDDYLFEIEPFIKACLVIIGTNLLCILAGYHTGLWYRFRLLEACIIPLAYWLLLCQKEDNLV